MFEIAKAEAAIFFRDGDAVQAKRAHLGPKLAREFVLGVDLGGHRRDAFGRVTAGGVADRVGGFAELEIELVGIGHQAALRTAGFQPVDSK